MFTPAEVHKLFFMTGAAGCCRYRPDLMDVLHRIVLNAMAD
jgi:hypothetical protein